MNKLLLILFAIILAGCQMPSSGFPPNPTPVPPPPPIVQPPPPPIPPSPGDVELRLIRTVITQHGNAARSEFGPNGTTLYLANEEGNLGALQIDISDPTHPLFVQAEWTGEMPQYLWDVAISGDVVAFHPSYGSGLYALDRQTWKERWRVPVDGAAHAVCADNERFYLPVEGGPGKSGPLVVKNNGEVVGQWKVDEAWANENVYGCEVSEGRIFVGSAYGTYIFDHDGALLARIPGRSSDLAVRGNFLYKHAVDPEQYGSKSGVEQWDISDPRNPRLVTSWVNAENPPDDGVYLGLPGIVLSPDGTKLYVGFGWWPKPNEGGPRGQSGVKVFTVSPGAFVEAGFIEKKLPTGSWLTGSWHSISPNGRTLAVSFWSYGVIFFDAQTGAEIASVATTGEARDVYVDNTGALHVFAVDSLQSVREGDSRPSSFLVTGLRAGGGYVPFRDGMVITPNWDNTHWFAVYKFADGKAQFVGQVAGGHGSTNSIVFDDPYIYGAGNGLSIWKVVPPQGTNRIADAQEVGGALAGEPCHGIVKTGLFVWLSCSRVGTVVFDVTDPALPREIYRDPYTFEQHGRGRIVATGRYVYVGAGTYGVPIYWQSEPLRVGRIAINKSDNNDDREWSVNFLELVGEDFLLLANYWTTWKDGLYLFDLRETPQEPRFVTRFPEHNDANFKVRVFGQRIYRVALYGVDLLEMR